MPLPEVPLPTGEVEINGTKVPIKSLSRDAVIKLGDIEDMTEAETMIIALGSSVTEDEAKAWRESVSAETADTLLKAIAKLSGVRRGKPEKNA